VDRAIRCLIKTGKHLNLANIERKAKEDVPSETITILEPVADLISYDDLLEAKHAG